MTVIFACCDSYRQAHAEDVYHHTDDHPLERESSLFVGGKRYHDVPHKKIDRHTIKRARNVNVLNQRANPAIELYINESRRKGDEKV